MTENETKLMAAVLDVEDGWNKVPGFRVAVLLDRVPPDARVRWALAFKRQIEADSEVQRATREMEKAGLLRDKNLAGDLYAVLLVKQQAIAMVEADLKEANQKTAVPRRVLG